MGNFIVNQQYYNEELSVYHQSDNDVKRYFQDDFHIPEKHLQKAEIFSEKPPVLKAPRVSRVGKILGVSGNVTNNTEYDFENSVKIHDAMRINRVQASDERLWSYLCHVPYFKFVKERYKPQRDMQELDLERFYEYKDDKDRITIRNYLKNRFFTSTDNRSLRRNGVAFLWWAAELTKEPWEEYEGIPESGKEKYHYTKIILDEPDIYASTFERTIGKEPKIVFPLLDLIQENELGRNQYRELIKKINSDAHIIHFSLMQYGDVRKKLETLID